MNNSIAIRKYNKSDLVELMAAWEGANNLAHPFLSEVYIARLRQDIPELYIPNSKTWVAEFDNQVVGFISLIDNEIGAIFLLPKHHGLGIGMALMNKAMQLCEELEVEVFKANSIGRRFYDRCGFELMYEALHEQTNQKVLRLRYAAIN